MTSSQPSLDTVFDLLADQHRRYGLYYLADTEADDETALDVAEIAAQPVEWDQTWDLLDHAETTDRQEHVRINLYRDSSYSSVSPSCLKIPACRSTAGVLGVYRLQCDLSPSPEIPPRVQSVGFH